jgi:hypothetical protein
LRKYLFAGAVAGGLLLFGAAPAHADDLPVPAGTQSGLLGGLLNPAGGIDPADGLNVGSPLGGTVLDVEPGQNGADLSSVTDRVPPAADGRPVVRTGLGEQRTDPAPATRPATGPDPLPQTGAGVPALDQLPVRDLLGGDLPLVGGLMPDGLGGAPVTGRESGLLDDGLLGGLGGLLPAMPAPAGDGDGMPVGGTPVDQPDPTPDPADAPAPAVSTPPAGPGDDDPRLQEEPLDGDEAANGGRPFSDGRPVAGEDADYR